MNHHPLGGTACCITWHVRSGLHPHLIPCISLCKVLDVKAAVCGIFLVRCGGSASFFVLNGKSQSCALGYSLTGRNRRCLTKPMVRPTLGWNYSYTPLHRSQILLLYICRVSCNLYFYMVYFCYLSNTQLHSRRILASLATFPRVKILG